MRPLHWGLLAALITFLVDQGFKHAMLDWYDFANQAPLQVFSFFDIVLAWNKGVSYSLFTANNNFGRYALLVVYLIAVLIFVIWLFRATQRLTALGLGLLIGGATGNALDRLLYGAVADFFHLHFNGFSPFGVFNLADMAIVAGVALLLYESFFVKDQASSA